MIRLHRIMRGLIGNVASEHNAEREMNMKIVFWSEHDVIYRWKSDSMRENSDNE